MAIPKTKRMKIGFELSFFSTKKTGVDYYAYNLIRALSKIDKENQYYLYLDPLFFPQFSNLGENFFLRKANTRNRLTWVQFVLPFQLHKEKIDILHCPAYIAPLFTFFTKTIITIHDMSTFLFPKRFTLAHNLYYYIFVPLSCWKAKKIIAVSENTKKDIIKIFKIPASKIEVIYEGIEPIYHPVERDNSLPYPYLLFCGTLEPRKNISTLLDAFSLIKDKIKEYKLVIVGKKGWLYQEIFEKVKKLKLEDRVIFKGYLQTQQLPSVYSNASLFIYPSFYEGFGFPPLEAMACGVPVITSNTSSLPEVCGDAGIMINPENPFEIAQKIIEVINDKKLKEEMIKKGFQQVKKFQWEKAAFNTLKLYQKCV